MFRRSRLALLFLFVCGPLECCCAAADPDDDACPLWLAPSYTATEKEIKYGLFAGHAYRANETLAQNAELAIPMIDFDQDYNRQTPDRDRIMEFMENHMWTAENAGSQWEGNLSAPVFIPGIGVLANYHTGISNVDYLHASVLLRQPPTQGVTNIHPGTPHLSRGAMTPYYNVTLKATQDIPAGMELFANFGDVWDGNYTDDTFQDTIHRYDYDDADKIIDALVDFYENDVEDDDDGNSMMSPELQEEILEFVLQTVLQKAAGRHAKTIRSLIPDNPRKLKKVQQAGGSFLYRYQDMIRSTKWLQKNGFCLDALKMGPSTIPEAGRGAFATRAMAKGQSITISPMLHIADKDLMTMYPVKTIVDDATGQVVHDYDRRARPIGKQLFLNYCFGHAESSLLLFPLGSMVTLINHSRKTPNAYMTWSKASDNGLANQHKYHDVSVQEMAQVDKVVIVMKVVALRDIAEGEEVLLDYGHEWEAAWQDYRIKWEMSKEHQPHPLKAEDAKAFYQKRPLETPQTIQNNPYPPKMATACFLVTRERPDGQPMIDVATILDITEWYEPASFENYKGGRLFAVDVLERHEAPGFFYNYTVNARVSATHLERVVNVPHAACTFIDSPYASDIHTKGAFRHSIGILDSHFPQSWRDLR